MSNLIKLTFLLCLFSSCFSVKPSSQKSGKKLFETFYVGEEGTQYFIKPLTFTTENKTETMLVDYTFRYKNEIKDSVSINLTIRGNEIYKNLQQITFKAENMEVSSNQSNLLFNERGKKGFVSRFSTDISLMEMNTFFKSKEWNIELNNEGKSTSFYATKKTTEAIKQLNESVFFLIN